MFHTVLGPVAFFRDISQKLEFNSKGFFSVFLYVFGIRFLSPKNYVTIILQKERGFLNDRNDRFMNLDELVNKYHTDLNPNDLYIWEYLSKHRMKCSEMTIEELSKQCNVSKTSIIRFAKKLSLSGFSELKTYLKMQPSSQSNLNNSNLDMLCNGYIQSIQELKERNMESVFEIIYHAKRVFLYGSGAIQLNAAKELYRMFFNGGDYFYYFDGKTDIDDILYNFNQGDVMIMISLNGESDLTIEFARKMKLKDIPIISITKSKHNTLASLSDENVYFSTTNLKLPGEHGRKFESTTAFFILCEIFYIRYQEYKAEKEKSQTK